MRTRSVLHLNDRLSARGGADVHLLGVIRAQTGSRVHLAVGRDDGSTDAGCPVTRVNGLDARTAVPCPLDPLLDEVGPDIVHIHNVMNPHVLEQAAAWPAVATVQDHRAFCPGRGKLTRDGRVCTSPMSRAVCAGCFEDTDYFERIYEVTQRRLRALSRLTLVVLSRYMKLELVAAGLDPCRIHVVPPFVWGLDEEPAPEPPPCVLFCGRLVETKGVLDAVTAWRLAGVGLPLVFLGAGPMRAMVERTDPDVTFQGWVPHGRLGSWYRAARVVIMPSRWQEPFGITGLEALTTGTPVATWRSGGIPDWYQGPPLPAWGDVHGVAQCIRELVGTRAIQPRGFDEDTLMDRLDGVYEGVLSCTHQRSPTSESGKVPSPSIPSSAAG